MFMDMALNEERVFLRVKAAGNILCELQYGTAAEFSRILTHGNAVLIHNAVIALIFVREGNPVLHGAEIAAEMKIP